MKCASTIALLIPAYNAARWLPELLRTADQAGNSFDEIWVYDDCSTDGTAEIARALGAKVVSGDKNCGCTEGKSVLVQRTGCDWVHFHDADDLLLPGFLEASRQWMQSDDADVVAFGCEERWGDTGELISISVPDDESLARDPVGYTLQYKINAISGIYRRSSFLAAGGFDLDPQVLYNEDEACHCKLARAGLRFRGDRRPLVLNRRQRSSMSVSNQDKCLRAHLHVLLKAMEHPSGAAHKSVISEGFWKVAAGAAAHLDWETADLAAALGRSAHGVDAAQATKLFRALCWFSPKLALRIREYQIRLLRPELRADFPGWRLNF